MESITPLIRANCFSFILSPQWRSNTKNTREQCMVLDHGCENMDGWPYNTGIWSTSALTSPRCAALLHVGVAFVHLWLDKRPPLFAWSASNCFHRCILRACMPCDATVSRRILLRRRDVCRTADSSTAVAEESVDDRHHSSPQQTAHLPLLCFGLHLFLSSPWTLPVSGATWAASRAWTIACVRSFCLTHPEKLPILSAIMAVCSSSVIVFGIFLIGFPKESQCVCTYKHVERSTFGTGNLATHYRRRRVESRLRCWMQKQR